MRLGEHGLALVEAERGEVHEVGDRAVADFAHRLADDGTTVGMADQHDLGVVAAAMIRSMAAATWAASPYRSEGSRVEAPWPGRSTA